MSKTIAEFLDLPVRVQHRIIRPEHIEGVTESWVEPIAGIELEHVETITRNFSYSITTGFRNSNLISIMEWNDSGDRIACTLVGTLHDARTWASSLRK